MNPPYLDGLGPLTCLETRLMHLFIASLAFNYCLLVWVLIIWLIPAGLTNTEARMDLANQYDRTG